MTVEEYGLGQDGRLDTACYWLEFKTTLICSMRGGSAAKHLIYFSRSDGAWREPLETRRSELLASSRRCCARERSHVVRASAMVSREGVVAIGSSRSMWAPLDRGSRNHPSTVSLLVRTGATADCEGLSSSDRTLG